MRRQDKEITDKAEIDELLAQARVGRLGTCLDGIPYITPVNFVYDGGKIFFHSAREGRKITNIAANPNVCFEVAEVGDVIAKEPICRSSTAYRSVIVFGQARQVSETNAKLHALRKMAEKYAQGLSHDAITEATIKAVTVFEIEIKDISAKRSPAHPGPVADVSKK
ncbi:MAG: pyridoxamine 5'-phosphate oxidase family protein [Candidatus Brocadiales bacterium]